MTVFLELTHTVEERDMESQLLDTKWTLNVSVELPLNQMQSASYEMTESDIVQPTDTPGHVDFTYESQGLGCCEGAVLVVDATQRVTGTDCLKRHVGHER